MNHAMWALDWFAVVERVQLLGPYLAALQSRIGLGSLRSRKRVNPQEIPGAF